MCINQSSITDRLAFVRVPAGLVCAVTIVHTWGSIYWILKEKTSFVDGTTISMHTTLAGGAEFARVPQQSQ